MPLKQSREAGKVPDKCALPCTLLSFGQGAFFCQKGTSWKTPASHFTNPLRGRNMEQHEIQVNQKLPFLKSLPLSFQHLFAMFGSTVLVPVLFKVDPATILFMNGIGTLLYILITKGKIPAYLGPALLSSRRYLPFLQNMRLTGYSYALGGFLAVGIILVIIALIVKIAGTGWIEVVFPPAAMGAIVAVIGLQLVPTAAQMAGLVQSGASVKHWSPPADHHGFLY